MTLRTTTTAKDSGRPPRKPPTVDHEESTTKNNKEEEELLNAACDLQDHGSVSYRQGNFQQARSQLKQSLALKREYYNATTCEEKEAKNMDLAHSLEELARVCCDEKDYSAAKRLHHEALDMKRLVYGRSSATAATTTTNTGQLGMKQQMYGHDVAKNSDLAYTVSQLATVAYSLKKYHVARKKYAAALDMYRDTYGGVVVAANLPMVRILLCLAQVSKDMGKLSDSEEYMEQAVCMALLVAINDEEHELVKEVRTKQSLLTSTGRNAA